MYDQIKLKLKNCLLITIINIIFSVYYKYNQINDKLIYIYQYYESKYLYIIHHNNKVIKYLQLKCLVFLSKNNLN